MIPDRTPATIPPDPLVGVAGVCPPTNGETPVRFLLVGLDLSLSATGLVFVRPDDAHPVKLDLVLSSPTPGGAYPETLTRLRTIARRILDRIDREQQAGDVVVVTIEAPSFGSVHGHVHTRAGLWWLMYHLLEKRALIVTIEPSRLKRYVTGKGNAPKTEVLARVAANFPNVGITDDNQADALALACMTARELGLPIEPSPQRVTPGALEGVAWPAILTEYRNRRTPA